MKPLLVQKIHLATAGIQDDKYLVYHLRLIDVVEDYNSHTDACINNSMCNNLKIYAANLGKE